MAKRKKPTTAYLDLDSVLFLAASAGEQVVYTIVARETEEVLYKFKNAKDANTHLEFLGHDPKDENSPYRRDTTYEIHDVEECYKVFDNEVKSWVEGTGCKKWVGYVSKNTGLPNFRHKLATLKPYKGSRKDVRKPHHLEAVRKYALRNPNIKASRGAVEVDDIVVAMAERKKHLGCAVGIDKDARQVHGCWLYIPTEHEKPVYSNHKIVGKIRENDAGKVVGLGPLFLLFQLLKGDSVDGIGGCKRIGDKKALEALLPFSGEPVARLPDAVKAACAFYEKAYGDAFEYKHHETGDVITATWQEVLKENLRLLWMKRGQDDEAEVIWAHVPK